MREVLPRRSVHGRAACPAKWRSVRSSYRDGKADWEKHRLVGWNFSEALVPAIRPYLDRPYAFFGHSMGATIGFELAHQLCAQDDLGPLHLFVSGSRAPQVRSLDQPIHHLPDEEFIEELRRFNSTPEAVLQNTELMWIFPSSDEFCGLQGHEFPLDISVSVGVS